LININLVKFAIIFEINLITFLPETYWQEALFQPKTSFRWRTSPGAIRKRQKYSWE